MADGDLIVQTVVAAPPGSPSAFLALGPGDPVPEWALDQLGGHCFEGGKTPKPKAAARKPAADSAAKE